MRQEDGFTLVEMMLVVTITSILAMMAGPLTGSWVTQNTLDQSANVLQEAYGRAKAAGLRNRFGIYGDNIVSMLCVQANVISVREATDKDTPASCSTTQVWKTTLQNNVSILSSGQAATCFGFNAQGFQFLPTNNVKCASNTKVRIVLGSELVDVDLN
jgi:prepilin-type N-terminal cleavage/methylation domain-containing protein